MPFPYFAIKRQFDKGPNFGFATNELDLRNIIANYYASTGLFSASRINELTEKYIQEFCNAASLEAIKTT